MEIFRDYDIRGEFPKDLNEEVIYKIGRCLVKMFEAKNMVIGMDVSLNSPKIRESLIKAVTDSGADVVDLGLAGTDVLYFAGGFYNFDSGVEITASHAAGHLSGMKIVGARAKPFGKGFGMEDLKKNYGDYKNEPISKKIGKVEKKNVWEDFAKESLKFIDVKKIKPLKIVVDSSNAVGALEIDHIEKYLPVKFIKINWELDGHYPGHQPNPFVPENRQQAINKVKETGADMGLIFDGDADRVYFIDENGEYIYGVYIGGLIASKMLKSNPGKVILHDVRAIRYLEKMVLDAGGIPKRELVGHAFFKERMEKENAIFGCESSGHIYYNFNGFMVENSIVAMLQIIEMMSETGKSLGELTREPRKTYPVSGEYNFALPGTGDASELTAGSFKVMAEIVEKMKEKYKNGNVSDFDTLTVNFPDWGFNLRPSANDPVIRFNMEADSVKKVREKTKEISDFLISLGCKLVNESGLTQVED